MLWGTISKAKRKSRYMTSVPVSISLDFRMFQRLFQDDLFHDFTEVKLIGQYFPGFILFSFMKIDRMIKFFQSLGTSPDYHDF